MSLRVTLNETTKRLPATGFAGMVTGFPMTGSTTVGAVSAAAAMVIAVRATPASNGSVDSQRRPNRRFVSRES